MKTTDRRLKIVCVIPARLGSTRLLEKPLLDVAGKPLVWHVYESISRIELIDEVIVAADDIKIIEAVHSFGGDALLTPKELKSGTDRVSYAMREKSADVVVNVQCDEPFIRAEMIETGLAPFLQGTENVMGSLKTQLTIKEDLFDPHVVKVVTNKNDIALYFSRFPVPYLRDKYADVKDISSADVDLAENVYYKHLGIYFYKKEFLMKFSEMPVSPLERAEKLEQLRALENGFDIVVPTTEFDSIGVDTEDDLIRVRKILNDKG